MATVWFSFMQIKNTEEMAKDLLNMKLATVLFGLLALMIITPRHCMANNFLLAPNGLRPGEAVRYGNYTFVLSTGTCQLRLFDYTEIVWISNDNPPGDRHHCHARIQTDGNFVLTNAYGDVVWSSESGQGGTNCYVLVLQGDRNVVIYGGGGGGAIWATGTDVRTSTSILGQNSTATIVTSTAAGGGDDAVMVN